MATFPVKYINNAMRGAPQLSGTAGTLIAVLDAFLITGFGQVTALSVTVASGIATASLQAGQSFDPYCVVLVDGATPAELNGEARVLTSSSTSITFATTAPDGVATGTITIKVAPVGQWEKPFTGTNRAVYRSTDVTGPRFCLWVDDSGTTAARVRGFENMTDVNTGTGPFPSDAQISGSGYWAKSSAANANAVRWDLFADSRFMGIAIASSSGGGANFVGALLRGFGDCLNLGASDAYATVLNCADSAVVNTTNASCGALTQTSQAGGGATFSPRGLSQLGSSVRTDVRMYTGNNSGTTFSGADNLLGGFPSRIDGELKFSRCYIRETTTSDMTPRANIPGVLYVPQSGMFGIFAPRDTVLGTGPLAGRRLLALVDSGSQALPSASNSGVYFIDITGPWR